MKVSALRNRRSAWLSLAIGLGMIAAPTVASAVPCTPQYVQLTNDPASKVLVNCCKKDGSNYKADGAKCINPANVCQYGSCSTADQNGVKTCQSPWHAQNGQCVVKDQNGNPLCLLGTCGAQVCQTNSDNLSRCDDNNDCTDDICGPATTYASPDCPFPPDDSNTCTFNDTNPCTDGACSNGTCVSHYVSSGVPCSSVLSGDPPTCTVNLCDGMGNCQDTGQSTQCTGTLPACKDWSCTLSGSNAVCIQVNSQEGTDCDTNSHDCTIHTCNKSGRCVASGREEPDVYICDTTFADPILADCTAGVCDAQQNCDNESYYTGYNGQACNDNNVCTTSSTCVQGPNDPNTGAPTGTCKATDVSQCADSSVDCPVCNVGNCDPTAGPPNCGCP